MVDDHNNSIVIKTLPSIQTESVANLKTRLETLKAAPSDEKLKQFGTDLSGLISDFRSPMLGIGNEATKASLKNLDAELAKVQSSPSLPAYARILDQLQGIVDDLNQTEDHVRYASCAV